MLRTHAGEHAGHTERGSGAALAAHVDVSAKNAKSRQYANQQEVAEQGCRQREARAPRHEREAQRHREHDAVVGEGGDMVGQGCLLILRAGTECGHGASLGRVSHERRVVRAAAQVMQSRGPQIIACAS